ncbi:lambda exonuclease family protein [Xanthobacter autotrophicus]|uniref:lambda exonuclease family protein n=1 Tax=Xanthobacter autotrophicus TaxID=280 RepID=UPI00372C92ED
MIHVHECAQGSEDWFRARMGIPTASEFATVLAKGKDGGKSETRRTYMLKLAGEILTGEPMERYGNSHTDRGHEMEPEARELYAFAHGVDPQIVGFITNGSKGCSPDALIGSDGVLEIKTKLPHKLIECLLKDNFPAEHRAQCQGALWVTEREWVDIAVYWPGLPLFEKRAYRDDAYIATMAKAVDEFNAELADLVERVRRYGADRRAAA